MKFDYIIPLEVLDENHKKAYQEHLKHQEELKKKAKEDKILLTIFTIIYITLIIVSVLSLM